MHMLHGQVPALQLMLCTLTHARTLSALQPNEMVKTLGSDHLAASACIRYTLVSALVHHL